MTVVCPQCKGRCCRDQDYGYRVEHMGAESYEHVCDHCVDGDAYVHEGSSKKGGAMTEEQVELSRRAVACKGWKWMPGMADQFGRRVMEVYPDGLGFRWSHLLENNVVRDADALPDLSDYATLGCLVGLTREPYHAPWKLWDGHIEVRRDHQTLFFAVQFRHTPEGFLKEVHVASGTTEVEAWVGALEAACRF